MTETNSDNNNDQTKDAVGEGFSSSFKFFFIAFGADVIIAGNNNLDGKINDGNNSKNTNNLADYLFESSGTVCTGINARAFNGWHGVGGLGKEIS